VVALRSVALLRLAGPAVVLAAGASISAAEAPASPRFVLLQSTLDAAGEVSVSTGHVVASSLGQPGATEASGSASFWLQSGFRGLHGLLPVPAVLWVRRSALDDEHCDLTWSGNDPPYVVHVAADCPNVLDALYAVTDDSFLLDVTPPPGLLICFDVEPCAPGPAGGCAP